MLDWLKAAWAKWKVQISVVGGVLVIATAYGTCTVEPALEEVSATTTAPAVETTAVNSVENNTEEANDNQNADNTTATDNQATTGNQNDAAGAENTENTNQ